MSQWLSSPNLAVDMNKRHLSPPLRSSAGCPLCPVELCHLYVRAAPLSVCCTVAPDPCWNLITTVLFNWNGTEESKRGGRKAEGTRERDNRASFIWNPSFYFQSHFLSVPFFNPCKAQMVFYISVNACFFLLWWIESKEGLRLFQITHEGWKKGGQGFGEGIRFREVQLCCPLGEQRHVQII